MNKLYLILLILLGTSCANDDSTVASDTEAHIKEVEEGLVSARQIKGAEIISYNIEERLKELGIPGLSIAVVTDGEIEWAKSYGMADISEGRAMTNETLQLAASISKPISALRVHQLVEEGIFDLDEDVNSYLKSWKVPENEFTEIEKVTLRRILNHTAGLTVWGFPGYDKGDTIPSTVDVLEGRGNTDSVRVYKVPGESWMYSGGGYTVMQLAITDTEGIDFPVTMQENVLDRMNMKGSTFENPLPEEYHGIAATGYRTNGDEVEGKWPIYPEMAAAGLWTTPSMLIQYAIEIQRIYQSKQDGILTYNTVQEMLTPGLNGHGLGPGVGDHTFGHGGADEGFRSRLLAWKEHPHAIVVMVNSDNGSILQEVLLSFANAYGLPGIEPDVREVIEYPESDLQKYTGRYTNERLGVLEFSVVEGKLTIEGEILENPATLLAENDTLFFDQEDWQRIDFDLVDDVVSGFRVDQYQFARVE